jgi:hypothetical protein|tara:strand:- start:5073 stop:6545 length:1473 start_codon:yes stop_codon:yes gene_type:complete
MAYIVNKYDGTLITTVEDGTIDQTTDIRFIGRNYAGYGEIQNENFLHLLENFSGATSPSKAVSGQVWFDNATSKLKFYDGTKWRTTGGAEVDTAAPSGLTTGDFWWDTGNDQLYAWNGSSFVLVGPQGVGTVVTQLKSRTIKDDVGASHLIIEAVVNDETILTISGSEFTIGTSDPSNLITGFDGIKTGITLKDTKAATGGVTSTDTYTWGTASNSLKLGGKLASEYLTTGQGTTTFTTIASFSDVGYTVGDSNDLRVSIINGNEASVSNEVGSKIEFKVNDTGTVTDIAKITTAGILPGTGNRNIGDSADKWYEVHATSFKGNADSATAIKFASVDYAGATTAVANSTALRDVSSNITANLFIGTATQAQYADLAEKYDTDETYPTGTIVKIGGAKEATADDGTNPIGVISESPAYLMNSDGPGQAIAFVGKVPIRVVGSIEKGGHVYAGPGGVGIGRPMAHDIGRLVGISLEENNKASEKLVQCVLKV